MGGNPRPEHDTAGTGVKYGVHEDKPSFSDQRPTESGEDRPNVNAGGFGTVEPSVGADPQSAQKPEQKQQGGDRPLAEPSDEQTEAIKNKTQQAQQGQSGENQGQIKRVMTDEERENAQSPDDFPKDPDDHSGEPLKMHDGSAEKGRGQPQEAAGRDRSASVGQEGGGEHGASKGTGEKVVKATGFAAEGGDFDAAAPGAGKEATREYFRGHPLSSTRPLLTRHAPSPHRSPGTERYPQERLRGATTKLRRRREREVFHQGETTSGLVRGYLARAPEGWGLCADASPRSIVQAYVPCHRMYKHERPFLLSSIMSQTGDVFSVATSRIPVLRETFPTSIGLVCVCVCVCGSAKWGEAVSVAFSMGPFSCICFASRLRKGGADDAV